MAPSLAIAPRFQPPLDPGFVLEFWNRVPSAARRVLAAGFRDLAERSRFHIPDEQESRHSQAIAAVSLPAIPLKEVPNVP